MVGKSRIRVRPVPVARDVAAPPGKPGGALHAGCAPADGVKLLVLRAAILCSEDFSGVVSDGDDVAVPEVRLTGGVREGDQRSSGLEVVDLPRLSPRSNNKSSPIPRLDHRLR